MSSIEETKKRFDELKKKRDEAKAEVIQLETKSQSANESMESIVNQWKDEYGISTYEEAKAKADEMAKQLDDTLSKCEEFLSKAGV